MSDAYIHARRSGQNETFIIDSNCSLTGCRMTNSTFGFSERFTISGVFDNPQDLTADIRLRKTGTRNGVDLYAASGAIPVEDEDFHVSGYGVWMSNSISFVAKGNGTIQDLFLEMGYGMTVGNRSGSIPGGSASTWASRFSGAGRAWRRSGAVGRQDRFYAERSDRDSSIVLEHHGASVTDVSWANLPVNRNGTFDSEASTALSRTGTTGDQRTFHASATRNVWKPEVNTEPEVVPWTMSESTTGLVLPASAARERKTYACFNIEGTTGIDRRGMGPALGPVAACCIVNELPRLPMPAWSITYSQQGNIGGGCSGSSVLLAGPASARREYWAPSPEARDNTGPAPSHASRAISCNRAGQGNTIHTGESSTAVSCLFSGRRAK